MSVVSLTSQGIVREGVDAGRSIRIAKQLIDELGFKRTVWIDYLIKTLPDNKGYAYCNIRKNNLQVHVQLQSRSIHFTASNPERLKLRLDQILQEVSQ